MRTGWRAVQGRLLVTDQDFGYSEIDLDPRS